MSHFLEQFRMAGGDVEVVMERFMEDEELLRECLAQYISEDDFGKLETAIKAQMYKEAFEYAHALKGVVGNLGINPVYETLAVLVESLRHATYENLMEEWNAVDKAQATFKEHYKNMV